MVFTDFLFGAQRKRDSMKNKLASLLVVSSGKTLKEMPLPLFGRQMEGPSNLFLVMTQSS